MKVTKSELRKLISEAFEGPTGQNMQPFIDTLGEQIKSLETGAGRIEGLFPRESINAKSPRGVREAQKFAVAVTEISRQLRLALNSLGIYIDDAVVNPSSVNPGPQLADDTSWGRKRY